MNRPVLGIAARDLDDLVSAHFTVRELTGGRGWWPGDVDGEVARYENLTVSLELAREVLGCPMRAISGARPQEHNDGGRPSSLHLPPRQRALDSMRFARKPPAERGAALDFIPVGLACDVAFRRLDRAMRDGRIPAGGLFWYAADDAHPGPATGRFVHIDNRGYISRESGLMPVRRSHG